MFRNGTLARRLKSGHRPFKDLRKALQEMKKGNRAGAAAALIARSHDIEAGKAFKARLQDSSHLWEEVISGSG